MRLLVLTSLIFLLLGSALAQTPPQQQLSPADVQALLERMAKLEQRVAELEGKQAAAAPAVPAATGAQGVASTQTTLAAAPAQAVPGAAQQNTTISGQNSA